MKYTIKEFSEHLGITTDTLRLYERHGIVNPMKDEKNHYRYFDDMDARQLLSCRFYRSLDIALKEAAQLTLKADKTEICSALSTKKSAVYEEIQRLKNIAEVLERTERQLNENAVYEIKSMQTVYRFVQTKRNTLISDTVNDIKETQAWMEALPEVMYTFKGDLSIEGEISEYTWGMAMPEAVFNRHGFRRSPQVETIPSCTYLTTVVERPYEEYIQKSTYQALLDEAMKQGLKHQPFIWGRLILTAQQGEARKSYIELMLPIL